QRALGPSDAVRRLIRKSTEANGDRGASDGIQIGKAPLCESSLDPFISQNGVTQTDDFAQGKSALCAGHVLPRFELARSDVNTSFDHLFFLLEDDVGLAGERQAGFPGQDSCLVRFVEKNADESSIGVEVAARGDDIIDSPVFVSGQVIKRVASRLRNAE